MRVDRACQGLVWLVAICSAACSSGETPAGGAVPTLPPSGAAGGAALPVTGLPPTAAAGGAALPTTPPSGVGLPTTPPSGVGTPATPGAENVPCDVASVVSDNCTLCHSATPKFSAPMALMKYSDFLAPAKSNPLKKVFEVTPERINATDPTRRMPPASGTALAPTGLNALNAWLQGGAQPAAAGCAITEKSATPPTTGGTPPGTPTTPVEGGTTAPRSGSATDTPQDYQDPMMECYEFRAHAQGDKKTDFSVSTTPDLYTNFIFAAPWQGMRYARSFHTLEGNNTVIHHWLFYKNAAAGTDGAVGGSSGAHPDGELVQGWAPGGSDTYYDPDVGLEMPATVSYTLETHHNNMTGSGAKDNSGIQVCVTPLVPKYVVSLSWLGTDNINGTMATGNCAPATQEPIHIIGVGPHMHTKGRHMTAEITRANGMKEMLHDAPFDFNYQHSYYATTVIMPGDSIRTTCTYSAPARFGEGTNDEMCYLFTSYYPKLSLTNGNPIGTLIHGPNTCLE